MNNIENKNNNDENLMSRKEFLTKTALGAASLAFLGKFGFIGANAATVTDNLNAGGVHISDKPPANLKMSWIDTKNDGVMKYWNGSAWTPIRSTWDE